MSEFKYIRDYYGVPAEKGVYVKYNGKLGVVTGVQNACVKVRLDGEKHARPYNPLDLQWEMSADLQCPYCNADIEVYHDDGFGCEEGVRHKMKCPKCEKNFVFTTTICFYHESAKADCLNDGEHDLYECQALATWECRNCEYSEKQKEVNHE